MVRPGLAVTSATGAASCISSWRGANSDGTNTVRAVAKEQAEIIFLGNIPDASLLFAEPALGTKVLEEREHTLCPFVLALQDGKRACDLGLPFCGRIGKAAGRFFGSAGEAGP